MKPVAIFRHARTEGPGYLADFLDNRGIPWRLIRIDEGDALPASAQEFGGLVFMGGPMSVNDDLAWIPPVLALIREAVAQDIPVLGHCLGGQLMSKALGGSVGRNPIKEIGWGTLNAIDGSDAQRWFGDTRSFMGFHWHGETFTIPEGATRVLASDYCDNQAFSLGKHLGFQCHIEMTEPMIREWCDIGIDEIEGSAASPGVQKPETVFEQMPVHLPKLNQLAGRVYEQWIKGLKS